MSLLLDARKKSLQAQLAQEDGHAAPEASEQSARNAGRNLFSAKNTNGEFSLPARSLLLALGVTVVLLTAGLGYLWQIDSQSSQSALLTPANLPIALATPAATDYSSTSITAPSSSLDEQVPDMTLPAPTPVAEPAPVRTESRVEHQGPKLLVARPQLQTVDPLLKEGYVAYRNGKLAEAQQLYLSMLKKDARNTDALLGLAVIAQQRGENFGASQYYGRVLMQDPRNAVAHAGMSALSEDNDGNESRLKNLLSKQRDSTALHFALGNLFAGQSRWSEAQQAYFNAWALEPDNPEFAYNLAVSLDHLSQNRLAAQYYQRALQFDPAHNPSFDHAQVAKRIERLGQSSR